MPPLRRSFTMQPAPPKEDSREDHSLVLLKSFKRSLVLDTNGRSRLAMVTQEIHVSNAFSDYTEPIFTKHSILTVWVDFTTESLRNDLVAPD